MNLQSYSLSGQWTLVKESDHPDKSLASAIPDSKSYSVTVAHSYEQKKWKYDYAYSRAVSRYHGYVWYYRRFKAPESLAEGERCLIEFDRVSYVCEVYINGTHVGSHKGSEECFSFDVTDTVALGRENLLAVRVFEPVCGGEAIEGVRLDLIPNGFWAGSETSPNLFPIDSAGGILEDVRVTVVPSTRITDVFILPDPKTGKVSLEISLLNASTVNEKIELDVRIADAKHGITVATVNAQAVAEAGESKLTVSTTVPEHKLWSTETPALYFAEIRASSGSAKAMRFGFKDFTVKNGFFHLNGKRMLLKCAHGTPSAETVIEMKAMGFNAFRSIQHVLPEEVLDLCDELGFMIIEAPLTSWGMRLHEKTGEMIRDSLTNMVRMHRSHVSIGAFYLFNELTNRDILHLGAKCLPELRALAPNALFLLSSGRWDYEYDLGSISTPYSNTWECILGNEGKAEHVEHTYPSRFIALPNLGMGDLHPYPYVPLDSAAKKWFRTVGTECDSSPVFISECGIGTHEHTLRCIFERLECGMKEDSESIKEITAVHNALEGFLSHYGMESLFSFASDICKASDRENGRQRQMLFDLIRSNPMINGFSLTSWGAGNEGNLEGLGVIKEGVAYAMQEGWAPLRWALFTSERVIYANKPFRIEAVLCNEDFLPAGDYKAEARIKGRGGIVRSLDFTAHYPSSGFGNMPPLAATVLSEEISLESGEYELSVRLLEGGCPFGGTLRFTVASPSDAVTALPKHITVRGLSDTARNMLHSFGVKTREYTEEDTPATVFVGTPKLSDSEWKKLIKALEGGTRVVFLSPELFKNDTALAYLRHIAGAGAKCEPVVDWLYHYDTVHIHHPIFDGIHDEGLLELDSFFELYPRFAVTGTDKADLTVAASVRVDAGNFSASLTVGEFAVGRGTAVINTFRIEEALTKNPYADIMLRNFISHYGK